MRHIGYFLIAIAIAGSGVTAWTSKPKSFLLDNWQIVSLDGETAQFRYQDEVPILSLRSKDNRFVFFSRPAPPQSVRSIEGRIKELQGSPESLKIIQHKGLPTSFVFRAGKALHLYSTTGGYLQATSENELNHEIEATLLVKVSHAP